MNVLRTSTHVANIPSVTTQLAHMLVSVRGGITENWTIAVVSLCLFACLVSSFSFSFHFCRNLV